MITIIAKFDVNSGAVAEFIRHAADVTRETRKEKGNLSYKIYQNRTDKTKFTFVEEWLNDTAIEQHNYAPHFTKFIDAIKPIINGDVQIEQLEKVPAIFF